MLRRLFTTTGLAALACSTLLADFTYQQTTTITGGALAGMMKVVGVFSKTLREPQRSTVTVKGDKMVHRGNNDMQIIDLAAETITSVDLQKKTYTVMTFAQMKEMIQNAQEKAQAEMAKSQEKTKSQSQSADIKWKVSAKDTGKSRQFAGYDAKEMLLMMSMEGTDQKSGEKGTMVVNTRLWMAPDVAGYNEIRDFYKRMAAKLNWTPNGNMFMARPDVAQGMAEATKEMSKLQGVPVFQTMVMGAEGSMPAEGPKAEKPEDKGNKPSIGSALGGALGGRFGLGKKKQEPPPPPPANDSAAAANQGALIEMETEYAGFSTAPVDASQLAVPAGFKQVEVKK
jgi:hypothetical protein